MASTRRKAPNDTPTMILDVAERLIQTRGFNGFSYADVAADLGLTKASLHYHFAGKAELGAALVGRYAGRFSAKLARIDRNGGNTQDKLEGIAEIYAEVLREGRMCLCGMLAAEYETLPPPMQEAVVGFFDETEGWIVTTIEEDAEHGEPALPGPTLSEARAILSGLEGAMLVARPYKDVDRFRATAGQLIKKFIGGTAREVA